MMVYYILQLIAGVALAQSLVAAIAVWQWQKPNENINYRKAIEMYFDVNIARYVVVAFATLVLCFILSDYLDLSKTKQEILSKGKDNLSKTELAQAYFKTTTICIGAFIEVIAVMLYKSGFKKIRDFGQIQNNEKN